ncbi:MAG: hypothetical protein AB7F50_06605 [Fimbriimonadaceae bacterium]
MTQVTEAFDGFTTVTTDSTQNVVQNGDHRTFSGHPLLQVSLIGSAPAWLSETGSVPNGEGETVTYEGNDRAGFHRRLVVVYAGSGRTRVVSAKEGFVLPEENLKPGQDQFQVASQVARSADGSTVTMDFFVGGKQSQEVTIAVEGQSTEASFDLLHGIGKGSPIVDMRLGAKAPVNYVFTGSLPSEDSISSPSVAGMGSGLRVSWVLVGIIGSALAVWLWKRK